LRIRLHPTARIELFEAAQWYEKQAGAEVAADFVTAYDEAAQLISSDYRLGRPGVHGTRKLSLRRFPFWIVYQVSEKSILVLAVAHWRRRPFYWEQRAE
jgi:toxin ParE1/3/4